MKKVIVCIVLGLFISQAASARDSKIMVPINDVLSTADAKSILSEGVELYWGGQAHTAPIKSFGSFVSNKKTNAFNRSDLGSCYRVFLSAVRSLQDRAYKEGGNAVVNIQSYYKKNAFNSDVEFECHAGGIIAGVALKGDVVRLPY
ncbi:MAG: hypothetical protein ACI93R_001142 [Flavobacteriales bacterium]|jgi:hypothetical protein